MTHHFEKGIGLSLLLFFTAPSLSAQSTGKYEVGIHAGILAYQGDLTPSLWGTLFNPSLAAGVQVSRRFTSTLSLRLDLTRGSLSADETNYSHPVWRRERALAFKTPVTELSAAAVYQPLGNANRLSPYVYAGAGLAFVKISRDDSRVNAEYFSTESLAERLAIDRAHATPRVVPVLPFGAGLRYRLTDQFSVSLEGGYRVMRTDYLDGFSKAGNAAEKDHYYSISAGLHYSFAGKSQYGCPVIRY